MVPPPFVTTWMYHHSKNAQIPTMRRLHKRLVYWMGFGIFVALSIMVNFLFIPLEHSEIIDATINGRTVSGGVPPANNHAFLVKENPLNDKSITWDPSVDRMWLDPRREEGRPLSLLPTPPAMILLTSYGWNQVDQTVALSQYSRQTRERELLDGIINHPWFHPTAWDDIENENDNSTVTIQSILGRTNNDSDEAMNITTRFYIFLDISSDCEVHYPKYYSFDENLDTSGDRVNKTSNVMYHPTFALNHPIWESQFMKQLGAHRLDQVKLIHFSCRDLDVTDFKEQRQTSGRPVVSVHISTTVARVDEAIDMGLPPPLLNKAVALNQAQIDDIYTCAADNDEHQRPYYITYIGNFRTGRNSDRFRARAGFSDLNDNHRMFGYEYLDGASKESAIGNLTYPEILQRSIFSGAPRGDAKYSYRFTEVLASGGIPIVMSDDWVLPFRPELVHWDECIILIPEKESGVKMLKYIDSITMSERCQRRQKCYDIYRTYMETGRNIIDGIVQGLELVALGARKNMTAIHCDPTMPDSDDCNPL